MNLFHSQVDLARRRDINNNAMAQIDIIRALVDNIDLDKACNAASFAALVVGTLCVTHLATVLYIGFHDINGHWDEYSLKASKNTMQTYLKHVPSFATDMFLILFPSLALYGYFYDAPLWAPVFQGSAWRCTIRIALILFSSCINNIINRLWAAFIHWAMHVNKTLYRAIHKKHHCHQADLCALSSWQDSYLEFFFMEVFGTFLLASFFNPLPIASHLILAAYNGVGAAIDHSGFYIPDSVIDGRYHWDHHLLGTWNYAEMESIDRYFGTLKVWKETPEYLKAPRIRAEQEINAPAATNSSCAAAQPHGNPEWIKNFVPSVHWDEDLVNGEIEAGQADAITGKGTEREEQDAQPVSHGAVYSSSRYQVVGFVVHSEDSDTKPQDEAEMDMKKKERNAASRLLRRNVMCHAMVDSCLRPTLQ